MVGKGGMGKTFLLQNLVLCTASCIYGVSMSYEVQVVYECYGWPVRGLRVVVV